MNTLYRKRNCWFYSCAKSQTTRNSQTAVSKGRDDGRIVQFSIESRAATVWVKRSVDRAHNTVIVETWKPGSKQNDMTHDKLLEKTWPIESLQCTVVHWKIFKKCKFEAKTQAHRFIDFSPRPFSQLQAVALVQEYTSMPARDVKLHNNFVTYLIFITPKEANTNRVY